MRKLICVPLLLVAACLCAGVYGAIHNQISYTVAPEYFTQFKFHQFHISPIIPDRLGAACVGWSAAWWMGIVIGVVLIPFGLLIPGTVNYIRGMLMVFGVVALTALIVGIIALTFAFLLIQPSNTPELIVYGNDIQDDAAFARAGTMHNFSYLGGLLGILTGAVMIFRLRRRSGTPHLPVSADER
ncbi:MAG: hypothetical protein CL681_15210 [Blastopirellula sp.]|mgnify:CR=1 FL=1|jgi:hypothetical protein|nr:hypothetical protein [Blastopirellula sp.]MAR11293.1 hypothetical protein [Blastopirellula sp.]